ncbi:MAG: polysaccharide deacetylase family protein, partial [Acidobacteria bacterium]|nr:polysaccharide deacetylase family protein [Acidobacteriota bacterium]
DMNWDKSDDKAFAVCTMEALELIRQNDPRRFRRIEREIDLGSRAIQNAIDEKPSLFRAPVGMKNWWVHPRLRERGMRLVGWSSRGWDTVAKTPLIAASRIMRDVEPGAIILVHEGQAVSQHRGFEVLEQLLPRLTQQGFRCVIPSDDQLR